MKGLELAFVNIKYLYTTNLRNEKRNKIIVILGQLWTLENSNLANIYRPNETYTWEPNKTDPSGIIKTRSNKVLGVTRNEVNEEPNGPGVAWKKIPAKVKGTTGYITLTNLDTMKVLTVIPGGGLEIKGIFLCKETLAAFICLFDYFLVIF